MNAPSQSGASAKHPFPGLRPFAYRDHEYFYGREDHIYALYRLIASARFIAVIGSSGSGKSSLVRAGLLPFLDTETREAAGRNWLWREMRPGDAPLQSLTALLASLSVDDDPLLASGRRDRIAAQLRRSSFGISEALAEIKDIADHSVVLVIDQFEELFRYAPAGSGRTALSGDEVRARDEATQFVQLLLQASQVPSNDIHVMLTMRSDFIGDCARFHGLPEAVCAAQFLVPSLTRDQLDEVIRKPVEKAGATIDPQLIERLLNDCGTEMDQLPVLQHCLSRLWEEAGQGSAEIVIPQSNDAAAEGQTAIEQNRGRHLSPEHYRTIGEFSDALSRHADEILKDLPGPTLQLAVEQIFRALSELDKEGRAVRRGLRFAQLAAETGVDEAAVRQVLDRFRAEDCSFLTPSPFEAREISDTTRIDIGHEALLRRWEKVSGRGADPGWLRNEQRAGERYRGLLATAEGKRAKLPSHLIDTRWEWWAARPRTEQWAERYGGGFARVQRLLQASRKGQRIKRLGIAAAFVLVLGAAGVMTWFWRTAERAQKDATNYQIKALEVTRDAMGRLPKLMESGAISAKGAEQLIDESRKTLDDLKNAEREFPLEVTKLRTALAHIISDVFVVLGQNGKALDFAKEAEQISEQEVEKHPRNTAARRWVYASKFRIGDALAKVGDNEGAETEYRKAHHIALQLASGDPANMERQLDLAFITNKIGDTYELKGNWKAAIDQYEASRQIAQRFADRSEGRREIATANSRIGQGLAAKGDFDAALAEYRAALAIQTELSEKAPEDRTLWSHLATTHRRIGGVLKLTNQPDKLGEAQKHYDAAVTVRKKLYEGDPSNIQWRSGLVTDYILAGDVMMQKLDWVRASQTYNNAIRIGEGLALSEPSNAGWQRSFAMANFKRGDALFQRALAANESNLDDPSRRLEGALQNYTTAAEFFDKLVDSPKQAGRGDSIVNRQIRLSAALERAGDFLASKTGQNPARHLLASKPAGDPLAYYQKALEVIESATRKEPDNLDLQSRKSSITAKIEPLVTNRETRAQ